MLTRKALIQATAILILRRPHSTKLIAASHDADMLLKAYSMRVLFQKESLLGQSASSSIKDNDNPNAKANAELSETTHSSCSTLTTTQGIASQLCQVYLRLAHQQGATTLTAQQEQVLNHFALELGAANPPQHDLETAMASYYARPTGQAQDDSSLIRYETVLQKRIRPMCTPQYELVFSSLLAHVGMPFIVQLRQDLLQYIHLLQQKHEHNKAFLLFRLQQMNEDMKRMLSAWFSAGLLELRRITYETTAASIIEIIAKKESVHPIRNLQDLRTRLSDPHRRCFAFFHPTLPNEPLVFVHVALLPHLPMSMQELEDSQQSLLEISSSVTEDTNDKTNDMHAAVFYSINNTHKGLSGVDLGTFLIKRVVEVLKQELSSLETFATLSPLPNFRMWFKRKVLLHCQQKQSSTTNEADDYNIEEDNTSSLNSNIMFSSEEIASLSCVLGTTSSSSDNVNKTTKDTLQTFIRTLETTKWYEKPILLETFRPVLMKYAAIYLVVEKHRKRPLDGVAKFHVGNGAEMYRLNFLADKSRTGMHNSFGIMVNYNYNYSNIEMNRMLYETNGMIPVMEGVSRWLT